MITSSEKWINSSYRNRTGSKGFTLLELMITMAIVAIGVALAVPTYQNTMQKRRVTSAAESIAAFLTLAQGEAIMRNEVIAISVERESDGDTWCVGAMIRTAPNEHCECESTSTGDDDYCDFNPDGAGAPRVINQIGFQSFTMSDSKVAASASNDFYFYFDPIRGTKMLEGGLIDGNSHQVILESSNSKYSLQVDISVTGRVRICNPESTKEVPGFEDCV